MVTSSVCVCQKLERTFSTCSFAVLKCSSPVWNLFVSSTESVHAQRKKCSSLEINMFICSVIHIWRWVAKTILSLAMNAFVFLEVGLNPSLSPQKRTETRGGKFLKKLHFKLGLDLYNGQKQGRDEKTQEHYPAMEWWCHPLWPPTQCICIPGSFCTQQNELWMQLCCIGGQGGGCHHSVVR